MMIDGKSPCCNGQEITSMILAEICDYTHCRLQIKRDVFVSCGPKSKKRLDTLNESQMSVCSYVKKIM